ncbi:MAG TPA: alpha/beta hydrolase [Myxococcaceae bacterium]|nr:alpha/beta hydrolase [Myxococcaceae bacterium]
MAVRFEILMNRAALVAATFACGATLLAPLAGAQPAATHGTQPGVTLTPCHPNGVKEELRCGVYNVFEDRRTRKGRKLPLKIVVIAARRPHPDQGPVFYMPGGPGETATEMAADMIDSVDRDEHDVVLVDERGTGDGHRLDCPSLGSDDNLEGYLKPPFDPEAARDCRRKLERHFDLSQYTTAAFAEDLDEIRQAMGYAKINLDAGSFGTYAALMYIRRHGEHVRSAYLASVVTLSNRVPLYHAEAAQRALDELFRQCDQDAACHAAHPRLREDFTAVLAKVHERPVLTWVRHPTTGSRTEVHLAEPAFADAVRVMMYSGERARELPFLIEQARAGDFSPFADAAVRTIRGFYAGARFGLHYAITCNEFVDRIRPEEVEPATRGSYFGAWRVNGQIALCKAWPKTHLPGDHFEPFRSEVPAVLISGDTDPVTSPRWGEEVKSFMPNAIHLVVTGGGHTPDNDCTRSIRSEMFRRGATRRLDVSCIAKLRPAPFKLPVKSAAEKSGSEGL